MTSSTSIMRRGGFSLWPMLLLLLLSALHFFVLVTANSQEESILRRWLLSDYAVDIRPSVTYAVVPTQVQMDIRLMQIFELEEKIQVLKTSVLIHQEWKDPRLTWLPANHGGLQEVSISPYYVWVPDVLLINNAEKIYSGLNVGKEHAVRVRFDGTVTWYSNMMLRSSCKMKVRLFPFDEQFCLLVFAPWTHPASELELVKGVQEGRTLWNYTENSAWSLDGAYTFNTTVGDELFPNNPKPAITLMIHVRRKAFYYFFFLFAPCALTSILMCMVFLLPPDCGERMVVGVTNLLALTVFYMLAAKNIPETSEDVPLMGRYYSLSIGEMSICMFLTSFVLRFHHNQSTMPRWIRIYILGHLAHLLHIETPQNTTEKPEKGADTKKGMRQDYNNLVLYASDGIVIRRGATGLGLMAERLINEARAGERQGEWQLAGKVLNFLFLLGHIASTVIIVLSVFLQAPGFIASRPSVPLPVAS